MDTSQHIVVEKNSNLFARLLFQYRPYWLLFLILLLLAVTGGWIYLKYATPVYESTARILIKDEKKGLEDSKTMESLNTLSTKKIIENEIEVIQSRTLLDNVVQKLNLYVGIYEKTSLKDKSVYKTSPIAIKAKDPEALSSSPKVDFKFDAATSSVLIDGEKYELGKWVNTPYGTLEFTAMPKFKPEDANKSLFFTISTTRQATENLQRNLKVNALNKQASILELTLRDELPERSEDILNALLTEYSRAIITDKNILAANTMQFVEERLKSVELELDSIEKKIQVYKSKTGAIDVSAQGKLMLENVSANDQRLGEMNMQMAVLNQVKTYVQSQDKGGGGIVPSTLGVTDPTLAQLVNKLYTLELDYESQRKTAGENSTVMIALRDQIGQIKPNILANIENQRQSLMAGLNNVAATNRQYSVALQSFPEQEKQLIDINRQQSIKNGIYTFLLQKREETALSYASTVPDSMLIDKAQSTFIPVSPKKKLVYLSALLAALLIGIAIVTGKESLSQKIIFRKEIEMLTALPIIGEITAENTKDPIVIQEHTKSFIAEQFRKLRSSLGYIGVSAKRKRILVTSSISGEGKSFIATNLAISLAITGKKVVLLDFDLNNPSINNKLNISSTLGITDFLLGEKHVEDIILETDVHPNLSLIPTGQLPHNPSELLMNGLAEELLNQLDGMFDYIVIDTAPVGPVTDAYMLSPFVDATLYVVRHKYTPKVFIEQLDEENKMHHLHNVAIVFNGVEPRGFGNKKYGRGYGYGYNYKIKESRALPRLRM